MKTPEHFEDVTDTFLGMTKVKLVGVVAFLSIVTAAISTVSLGYAVSANHRAVESQKAAVVEGHKVICVLIRSSLQTSKNRVSAAQSAKDLNALADQLPKGSVAQRAVYDVASQFAVSGKGAKSGEAAFFAELHKIGCNVKPPA